MNGLAKTKDGRSFALECCMAEGHVWKEIDTTDMIEEVDGDAATDSDEDPFAKEGYDASANDSLDTTTVVTYSVKILYTAKFAQFTPDVQGFVDTLIDESNQGRPEIYEV